MTERIAPECSSRVEPLLEPLYDLQPVCCAVLRGALSGTVVVDQPGTPRAAMIHTDRIWCFLAGDPNVPGVRVVAACGAVRSSRR